METAPPPATETAVVVDVPADERVTRDDLRSLRRWMVVAGVWAVAATAVALIALLDTSGDDAERTASGAADSAAQVREAQRRMDTRLEQLDIKLGALPRAEDVSSLQTRLGRIEKDTNQAATDEKNVEDKVTDLTGRVKTLEDAPADNGGSADSPGGGSTP